MIIYVIEPISHKAKMDYGENWIHLTVEPQATDAG